MKEELTGQGPGGTYDQTEGTDSGAHRGQGNMYSFVFLAIKGLDTK